MKKHLIVAAIFGGANGIVLAHAPATDAFATLSDGLRISSAVPSGSPEDRNGAATSILLKSISKAEISFKSLDTVNGNYIAVDGKSPTIFLSNNLSMWYKLTVSDNAASGLNSIAYSSDGEYAAVGNGGITATCSNNTNCIVQYVINYRNLRSITPINNGKYIAVGDGGTIILIDPSVNPKWSLYAAPIEAGNFTGVTFNAKAAILIAVDDLGNVFQSKDLGKSWTLSVATKMPLSTVTNNGGGFFASVAQKPDESSQGGLWVAFSGDQWNSWKFVSGNNIPKYMGHWRAMAGVTNYLCRGAYLGSVFLPGDNGKIARYVATPRDAVNDLNTWVAVSPNATTLLPTNENLNAGAYDQKNQTMVIAGEAGGIFVSACPDGAPSNWVAVP